MATKEATGGAGEAVGEELAEILDGCLAALDEEIRAVREELARRGLDRILPASGGRLLEATGPGFRYEWRLPREPLDIRPDDGVRIRTEAAEALGFVSRFHRPSATLRLSVSEWLGRNPGRAEMEFDPTWLLSALADRLEAILDRPERFHPETALRLLGRRYPDLGEDAPRREASRELNEAQRRALSRVLGSDVHFVWGPPGTGKTRLLGHAVAELAERGRVLVVATTNGAVDEAADRVAAALGEGGVRAGRVVRLGAEFSGTGDEALSLGSALERRLAAGAGGVDGVIRGLESRLYRGRRGKGNAESENYRARHARLVAAARAAGDEETLRLLGRVAREIQKQSALALREADVVLSTLAALAARDELASLRFDALVLDEASTAPLPYVVLAACLASERAVAIGDFQQLPAVVVSREEEAARWLSRDVFREAGVVREAPAGEVPLPSEHDLICAMLVEQYRMAPQVRSLVSDLFYGGRLTDAPEVAERPGPAWPLVLLDTSGMNPTVDRVEGSRANDAHVEAVVSFLERAAAAGIRDVAVVAPYRVQSRRIWAAVRRRLGGTAPRNLEVSTIHRFQGREKSVVVFDTVDAPPARSWFLNEGRNRDFPRLLNVALSRTRHMLVVVGTPEGLEKTLPEEALLNRVVGRIRGEGLVVDGRHIPREADRIFAPAS